MSSILTLLLTCAPAIHAETLNAVVRTESNYNPYAIAVVNGKQIKQPRSKEAAIVALSELDAQGLNYSVGIAQINKVNFFGYGVTSEELLNPCTNLKVAEKILLDCYMRSPNKKITEALSCYYSGNFKFGFVKEPSYKNTAYVERVLTNHQPESEIIGNVILERDYVTKRIADNAKKQRVVTLSDVPKKKEVQVKPKIIKSLPSGSATVQQTPTQTSTNGAFRF